MMYFTINLACDLCGAPQSQATISEQFGWTQETATPENYRALHNIVDTRCSPCVATHGDFKDLAQTYQDATGEDSLVAEAFVQANPKRADFTAALTVRVKALTKQRAEEKQVL